MEPPCWKCDLCEDQASYVRFYPGRYLVDTDGEQWLPVTDDGMFRPLRRVACWACLTWLDNGSDDHRAQPRLRTPKQYTLAIVKGDLGATIAESFILGLSRYLDNRPR